MGVTGYWLGKSFLSPRHSFDIPEEGFRVHPNADKPGDPKNAELDMKRMYAAIIKYRSKPNKLPTRFELAVPEQRAKAGIELNEEDFRVPDADLSDGYFAKDKTIHYTILTDYPRPDGSAKPPTPPAGERDVWVVCDKYLRNNQVMDPDGHSNMEYGGHKVVLWSNGQIELVPPSSIRLVRDSKVQNAMREEILAQQKPYRNCSRKTAKTASIRFKSTELFYKPRDASEPPHQEHLGESRVSNLR